MIEISLLDNKLTPNPVDCRAMVQNRKKKRIKDLVDQITGPGSILKDTECVAVVDALFKAIAKNLTEGYGLQTEYFSFVPEVSGVFEDENDRFDPARHEVTLGLRLGTPMKEALQKVKVTVIPHDTPMPVIKKVFDRKSKSTNDIITPGHALDIEGDLLKIIDEADVDQGVFLINPQKGEEVRISYFYQNTPKLLEVELPDTLKKGTYELEVRTHVNKANELRTGFSSFQLRVL
jgi:hypothetical protein